MYPSKNNKPQSGRSMIEMLGVLAIVGILSVGGIAGYRYAVMQMATNRALEIWSRFYVMYETEKANWARSPFNKPSANYCGATDKSCLAA